jgi:hypothetical protein
MVYLAADPLSGVLSILHFVNLGGKKENKRKVKKRSDFPDVVTAKRRDVRYKVCGCYSVGYLFSSTSKN